MRAARLRIEGRIALRARNPELCRQFEELIAESVDLEEPLIVRDSPRIWKAFRFKVEGNQELLLGALLHLLEKARNVAFHSPLRRELGVHNSFLVFEYSCTSPAWVAIDIHEVGEPEPFIEVTMEFGHPEHYNEERIYLALWEALYDPLRNFIERTVSEVFGTSRVVTIVEGEERGRRWLLLPLLYGIDNRFQVRFWGDAATIYLDRNGRIVVPRDLDEDRELREKARAWIEGGGLLLAKLWVQALPRSLIGVALNLAPLLNPEPAKQNAELLGKLLLLASMLQNDLEARVSVQHHRNEYWLEARRRGVVVLRRLFPATERIDEEEIEELMKILLGASDSPLSERGVLRRRALA